MWVIPTNKPGTWLHVWEIKIYLHQVLGVMPADNLIRCNVISATLLFHHVSLVLVLVLVLAWFGCLFVLYWGGISAHFVKRFVMSVNRVWNIWLTFPLEFAKATEHCYHQFKRIFKKNLQTQAHFSMKKLWSKQKLYLEPEESSL